MPFEIRLPFAGFYESKWSAIIDHALEREVEYYDEREDNLPNVASSDIEDAWTFIDYRAAYRDIARDYTEVMADLLKDALGFDLKLTFKDMTSPREYNFETDRVFCEISTMGAARLMRAARKSPNWPKYLADHFKSRDGFISYYDHNPEAYTKLRDCDHNVLMVALLCVVNDATAPDGWNELEWGAYYRVAECDYEYLDKHMDWPRYEAYMADLSRRNYARDLGLDDEATQEEVDAARMAETGLDPADWWRLPARCDRTPDMFAGA